MLAPSPEALGARCRWDLAFSHQVPGVELHQQGVDAQLLHPRAGVPHAIGVLLPDRWAEVGVLGLLRPGGWIKQAAGQVGGAVLPQPHAGQPSIARTSATTTERISGPSSLNSVPLGSSNRKHLISRGSSGMSVGFSV